MENKSLNEIMKKIYQIQKEKKKLKWSKIMIKEEVKIQK